MTNKMNHPLTDEMLQQLAEDPLDGVVGSTFVKEYMRAAYDLGYKAGYEKGEQDEAEAQIEREAGESL